MKHTNFLEEIDYHKEPVKFSIAQGLGLALLGSALILFSLGLFLEYVILPSIS